MNGQLLRNEPLSRHTSWRVGGPADRYYEPAGREDLADFVRGLPPHEPILWVGLGSNLLVRDGGWRGTVICLHGALDELRLEETIRHPRQGLAGTQSQGGIQPPASANKDEELDSRLRGNDVIVFAEAGVHCARLAKFSVGEKLAGAGFFAGIPGTVGGALAMNAGAHGGETWNTVGRVEVMFRDGSTQWLPKDRFNYGYRHVEWPQGMIGFIAARFRFAVDVDGSAEKDMKSWLARRKATQPVGKPSAGSTFRNPPGDHAARLIEACGLKGYRIGGAEVSKLHANFILTDETATAADVEALIGYVQTTVKQKQGIGLETEVKIVGSAR
jgi:UDP-N-acetylmuramate dehydrogenase